jgi:PAS domain S-box-containing protein
MKPTFDKWLVIGFGLIVALLLVNAGIVYRQTRSLHRDGYWVAHTHEVLGSLDDLFSTVKDAETGQRGFLITGNEKYLKPYEDAVAVVGAKLERLKRLIEDNELQQARIPRLQELIHAKMDELAQTVALRNGPGFEAAQKVVLTDLGKNRMDEIRSLISAIEQDEQSLLRDRQAANDLTYHWALAGGALGALMGLVSVSAFAWVLRSHLNARQKAAAAIYEQRELYRTTLASVGDAVMTTDPEARITYLNAVAESLTGWRNDDAAGRPLDAVFHILNEGTRRPVENPAVRALREGLVVGLANHTILIAKDKVERAIDDSAAPIRDEKGRVVGCVLIFRDITERRRLELQNARQAAAAHFLASIVESSNDAIISKSLDGVIQSWNIAAERLFGYTAEQAIGRSISMLIPADRADEEDRIIARLRAGEPVDSFETERLKSDGSLIPISLTISPIRDESGRIVGASKIARDITDKKEAENRIHDLVAKLTEADRRKDEFLATLAHELRNPLAPIRNAVEIVKQSRDDDNLLLARDTIDRQSSQLVRLVDDLLDMGRITSNKMELRKESVELASIIHHVVEASRPQVENVRHELTVSLPPEPIYLDADPVRLSQVFSNLLSNSCKYTDPGGKIWLTVERQNGEVAVSVKDNGLGIPRDKLSAVFEMFTQVEHSLDRTQGGLGIGLTLVKRLVEMHHGTVEARSEGPGHGSEFEVRLPIRAEIPSEKLSAPDSPPSSSGKRRILVVDDNRDSAESLSMLLKMTGNETQVAYDGVEALEAAERFQPEVVLLDIGLPKLNGYEVARKLREQPWGKNMVLVALTGWGQDEDRRKSQAAGFNSHMVKPVGHDALMKLLTELHPRSNG